MIVARFAPRLVLGLMLTVGATAVDARGLFGGHHGGGGGGHHGHAINAWMGSHRPRLR